MFDVGEYGDQFARAAALLVAITATTPRRFGSGWESATSFRDITMLFFGFYAAAKGHEAKGLARLALAQYLEEQAKFVFGTRGFQVRQKNKFLGVIGEDGKPHVKEMEQSDEEYSLYIELRTRDAGAIECLPSGSIRR